MIEGPDSVKQPTGERSGDVLFVKLADRDYALPLEQVLEVALMVDVDPIPGAPEWVAGLIDYRGTITPVVDTRARLGMARGELDLSTPMILASTSSGVLGLIVDEVEALLSFPASEIVSSVSHEAVTKFISATIHGADRLLLMLDLDRLGEGLPQAFSVRAEKLAVGEGRT